MRLRKRLLVLSAVLLAALLGVAGWLGGTTAGLRFLAARTLPLLPVNVEIAALDGRLVGPIILEGVDFAAPAATGKIARVELRWRPASLLWRTLRIDALHVIEPQIEWLGVASSTSTGGPARSAGEPFSLPLDVTLEHLAISRGALRSGDAVALEGIDLELSAALSGQALMLRTLELRSSDGQLSGHARLSMDPTQAWDVDLDWQLAMGGTDFAGRTRIKGLPSELDVAQDISAPLAAQLAGTVRGLPDQPAWSLDLAVEPLPAGTQPWPAALEGFAARLRIEGDIEDSLVTGGFEIPLYLAGTTEIEGQGGWAENTARVPRLELVLQDGATLRGNGWFQPGGDPAAEFMLSGDDLGWPLDGREPEIDLPRVQLRGTGAGEEWDINADASVRREGLPDLEVQSVLHWAGTLLTVESLGLRSADETVSANASGVLETGAGRLAYRFAASADAQLPELPPLALELEAEGDAQGLRVKTMSADLLGGTVSGAGRIAWEGAQAAGFRLEFADLDPAALAPEWPGRLAGTLELDGLPAAASGLDITLRSLRGELKSMPVSGDASVSIGAGAYVLRSMALALGDASLQASGRVDEAAVSLAAALEVPALEMLDPGVRGKLTASASVSGARDAPRVELEAAGERLRWRTSRARVLHLDATVDLSGATVSNAVMEMKGFALRPGRGASLRFEAGGLPQSHRARLELERPYLDQSFLFALEGELDGQDWNGLLTDIVFVDEEQPVWSLQAPARLGVASDALSLEDACMDGTFGLLCAEGNWNRSGPWRGSAQLARLDLERLSRRFGEGLLATGVLTGAVDIQADDELFRSLSGGFELSAGQIRPAEEADKSLFSWLGGSLDFTGDADAALATLRLELPDDDHVDGRLAVDWNADDPPVEGRLDAELSQLRLLSVLVPELAELQGDARIDAVIDGTLGAPQVAAEFSLQDGSVDMLTLGLEPHDIQANATLGAGGEFSFQLSGRSGEGAFESAGRFEPGTDGVEGRATLKGQDMLLANLAEAQLAASPDLRFHYSGRDLAIAGDVEIPFARITELGGATAVSTSPDEVLVGARAPGSDTGMQVTSRVRVSVGPDVQVNAAGLRGSIEGAILTVIQPKMLPWGRGELRVVGGTFSVFGQKLEIETGRLIYTGGPLENPGLEIRAVRHIEEVTAGALVRGTLQQPEVSVYSDPPMPRADALSYLTVGRSLSDLQSGERKTLNQAANSLVLSGGSLIAGDLGRRLGFDEVAVVEDDDGEGASLVVSRYIGGGIYVGYGMGLLDTVNTLRLRFQINPRLSLETISGSEHAGDLFYTFERD